MMHIIKWKTQEDKRSNSWENTIDYSRTGIEKTQSKQPSLNDDFIKDNWEETYERATKDAEKEMGQESKVKKLTWHDVFINKYSLFVLIIIGLVYFFNT